MDRCPTCKRLLRRSTKKPPTRVNGTTRAEDLEARRAARKAETAALREAVFRRANDECELCREATPTELHHLAGGSGRRTQQQTERNCMAVCMHCHLRWHRIGAASFVWVVREWAERHGYSVPASITKVA